MTAIVTSKSDNQHPNRKRWRHLTLGILCMLMIANLQYGWTLFVVPLHNAHGWDIAAIQFAFTLFVALETFGTPVAGWIADKLGPDIGPRVAISAGAALVALGWIIESFAGSLPLLYIGGALTGLGSGAVYTTCVGIAVKWFKDNRGLAVGLIAAGFGAGAALTIIPIRMVIAASGYQSAFFWFALIQGGVILVAAQFVRAPHPGEAPALKAVKVRQTSYSYSPSEVLRQPVFWVLYLLDVMMCAGGLIVTANLAPIANTYGVANVMIWGTTTLSVALIFANIMNGVGRPFFGWVGDRIGNTSTMVIAFALGAASYYLLSVTGHDSLGYVLFAGMIFLSWGNIFSLFPAMCTDLFGQEYATTNLSMLYTAKGAAAFLVPLGTPAIVGSWNNVLLLAAALNAVAVVVVLAVLRPAEQRHHTDEQGHAERVGRPLVSATTAVTEMRQPSEHNRPKLHGAA
jgi:MFS transporter, OFA family, oxalate/formate antiporter